MKDDIKTQSFSEIALSSSMTAIEIDMLSIPDYNKEHKMNTYLLINFIDQLVKQDMFVFVLYALILMSIALYMDVKYR